MMGFDVWSDGKHRDQYLEQCRSSTKYKRGKWYVLNTKDNEIESSLITYQLASGTFGIGSIATPPEFRHQGFATQLVQEILSILTIEGAKVVYLFSDIKPEFYERHGFIRLPERFQNHKDSLCMAWGTPIEELTQQPSFAPPAYF